ncbi:MAG TPA: SufD family Fe-S cluster assembly protein [Candidatus Limnocylindria bacterium]|nr:SufD family Fe-S cluster assembly protein [Candidatus Limnocylindria bacterium]
MTVRSEATRLDLDAILAVSEANREPDWLRELRRAWWQRAEATPWPTGKEEEWRRTSLERLPRDVDLLLDPPRAEIRLDESLAANGVVFADLRDAVHAHPDLVRRALSAPDATTHDAPDAAEHPLQSVGSGEWGPGVTEFDSHDKFWALAHAAWTGGTFLYVPADVAVDDALLARSIVDRGNVAYFPLTLVLAEHGARVTLLDEHRSPDGEPVWFGGVVDIRSGREAYVRYANLQRLGDATWNIGAQRVEVGPSADVTTLNAEIGSAVTKVGLDVRMTGDGGTSRVLGLLAAGDDQHIDINAFQDLAASHVTSDLLYLSALYERARAAFYGVTKVRSYAKQTSSYQECRNLLLSPEAGAEPIPVLEIETNDILRCGHGATAGAIDPVQLFYAQTRGLRPDEAERMIVRGFFEQVVHQIDSEPIKVRVLEALAGRIGTADVIEGVA